VTAQVHSLRVQGDADCITSETNQVDTFWQPMQSRDSHQKMHMGYLPGANFYAPYSDSRMSLIMQLWLHQRVVTWTCLWQAMGTGGQRTPFDDALVLCGLLALFLRRA